MMGSWSDPLASQAQSRHGKPIGCHLTQHPLLSVEVRAHAPVRKQRINSKTHKLQHTLIALGRASKRPVITVRLRHPPPARTLAVARGPRGHLLFARFVAARFPGPFRGAAPRLPPSDAQRYRRWLPAALFEALGFAIERSVVAVRFRCPPPSLTLAVPRRSSRHLVFAAQITARLSGPVWRASTRLPPSNTQR
jgi:hypothetical protein